METVHYVVSYGNLLGGHWRGRRGTGPSDVGGLSPPEPPSFQQEPVSTAWVIR